MSIAEVKDFIRCCTDSSNLRKIIREAEARIHELDHDNRAGASKKDIGWQDVPEPKKQDAVS